MEASHDQSDCVAWGLHGRRCSEAGGKDQGCRADAAKIGGMDRRTLRDWVHRFNAEGSDGLSDRWYEGPSRKLPGEHREALATIVEAGPRNPFHVLTGCPQAVADASGMELPMLHKG